MIIICMFQFLDLNALTPEKLILQLVNKSEQFGKQSLPLLLICVHCYSQKNKSMQFKGMFLFLNC
jgi:hypothetical protein